MPQVFLTLAEGYTLEGPRSQKNQRMLDRRARTKARDSERPYCGLDSGKQRESSCFFSNKDDPRKDTHRQERRYWSFRVLSWIVSSSPWLRHQLRYAFYELLGLSDNRI